MFCSRAADADGFYQLDLTLAYHRLHSKNVAKEEYRMSVLLNKTRKLAEIDEYMQILDAFEREKVLSSKKSIKALATKKEIMIKRREALEKGSLCEVISNGIRYHRHVRAKTMICDLFIVKQKNRYARIK